MYQYSSIPGWREAPLGRPCIGFRKYDGSNLRWEWTRKGGWVKMGTRERLFGADEQPFCQAVPLFQERFAEEIPRRLGKKYRGMMRLTVFTELYGASSFAGNHLPDEAKELTLFDVAVENEGILPVRDFLKLFGDLDHVAEVVYEGNFNRQFIEAVRDGQYDVYEGVVAKGTESRTPWMAKVKTIAYLERLKNTFGDTWWQYADGQ